jgi:hypothetical protein
VTRWLASPHALIVALFVLALVVGVSCWPRVTPATVTPTATPTPVPIVVIPAPATATPADIFTAPSVTPEEVILERTALPTSTVTPTVTPTLIPPPATETPERTPIQRG